MSGVLALRTQYRVLARHRLYAVLNIGGLALGIAVFLVLALFVQFERGFDRGLAGADRLWIVKRSMTLPGLPTVQIPTTPTMLNQLRADFPDLDGVRMTTEQLAVKSGTGATKEAVARVDPDYFRLFPFAVAHGDPPAALTDPRAAVVTERVARDYLGNQGGIGSTITLVADGRAQPYRVAAILKDLPKDLTFRSEIFVALPRVGAGDPPSNAMLDTFVRVPDAAAGKRLAASLPGFVARHPDTAMGEAAKLISYDVRPLVDEHLHDPRDRAVVTTLGIVGVLALAIAVVNYVNLATARAGLRAREVALRKVIGATRRALIAQFLGEAMVAVALATLMGLALAELALPYVNAAGGTALSIRYLGDRSILPLVVGLIVTVGLVAGAYPAFFLSRFQPAATLSAAGAPGGGRAGAQLRRILVLAQFAISIGLAIATTVLIAQTAHLAASDIGFDRRGLIMVPSFSDGGLDDAQRAALVRAVRALPGVIGVTRSAIIPGGGSFAATKVSRAGGGPAPVSMVLGSIGTDFFQVYRARVIAGRAFDAAHVAADSAQDDHVGRNVVLNRSAARALGFSNPARAIGQAIKIDDDPSQVIGVVDDLRFFSPQVPVDPLIYSFTARVLFAPVLTLRTAPDAAEATLDRLRTLWRQTASNVPFQAAQVQTALYEHFYRDDVQRARLFTMGAVLAAIIGCIGLYGLAAFDTARRFREIGIRKTLGASSRDVMWLLLRQFLQPVLLANLIAWPLAWFAMRAWLADFDDRIALSPLYFVGASVAALVIAALTIIGSAWRAARAEPAFALRDE